MQSHHGQSLKLLETTTSNEVANNELKTLQPTGCGALFDKKHAAISLCRVLKDFMVETNIERGECGKWSGTI